MLTDEHYRAREMVLRLTNAAGHELPSIGLVPKFSRSRPPVPESGPPLGAHTRALVAEAVERAGLDYADLRERGILADSAARAHGQARV